MTFCQRQRVVAENPLVGKGMAAGRAGWVAVRGRRRKPGWVANKTRQIQDGSISRSTWPVLPGGRPVRPRVGYAQQQGGGDFFWRQLAQGGRWLL